MTTRSPERVWAALLMSALALPAIANAQSEQVVPIGGRLVDPDGTPVRDARVAILTERNVDLRCEYGPGSEGCFDTLAARGGVRAEGRSNPDGRFTLAVPGGLTNFDHIWADGQDALSRRLINSLPIRPNRPTTATDLGTIALNRARELLVVVHGGGRPIAGAEVVFNRREKLWTDQAGEVLHRVFAPAASESSEWMAAFTVRAPGFAVDAWFGGLPAGSTTRMIDLVPEVPLAGRVWDSRGLPVPDGDVFLRPVEPWLGPRAASGGGALPDDTITSSRTDAMGRFLLHGLSPSRTYRVVVEAPGRLNAASVERVVSGGTAAMDVVLSAAGRVEVDVSGPPGTESFLRRLSDARAGRLSNPPISIEWFDPAGGGWQPLAVPLQVAQAGRERVRLRFDQVPSGTSGSSPRATAPWPVTSRRPFRSSQELPAWSSSRLRPCGSCACRWSTREDALCDAREWKRSLTPADRPRPRIPTLTALRRCRSTRRTTSR